MDWTLTSKWLGAGIAAVAIYGSTGIIAGYLAVEGYNNARMVYYTVKALREFLASQRSDIPTTSNSTILYDIHTYIEPFATQAIGMVDPMTPHMTNLTYLPVIQMVFDSVYLNNVVIYYGIGVLVFS